MNKSVRIPLVFLLFWCAFPVWVSAQTLSIPEFHAQRLDHQRNAMYVLGGWAAVNVVGGLALRANSEGATRRFHEMNAIWNVVNLGIAGLGYYGVLREAGLPPDTTAPAIAQHYAFQKILLFNAGLDLGYVATGAYLLERARRPDADADRLKGYGRSIVLQGGFLFVFDLVNYFISQSRDADIPLLLGRAQNGIGLTFTF